MYFYVVTMHKPPATGRACVQRRAGVYCYWRIFLHIYNRYPRKGCDCLNRISPYELAQNPFELINKKWAMVTTRANGVTNTMTASWGGVGILWNKPVAYVFLRPQRYTRELLDASELFSLCFLPEAYRDKLTYCGKVSGRDGNKLEACGFDAVEFDGAPVLAQANTVLTLKKLFRQQLTPDSFADSALCDANYPGKDFHYLYIAEILGVYEK